MDLLYWEGHYAWIKNFQGFIFDVRAKHEKKYLCKRCFGVLVSEMSFKMHRELCTRLDFDSTIYTFPIEGSTVKFKTFVICSDHVYSFMLILNFFSRTTVENPHQNEAEIEFFMQSTSRVRRDFIQWHLLQVRQIFSLKHKRLPMSATGF